MFVNQKFLSTPLLLLSLFAITACGDNGSGCGNCTEGRQTCEDFYDLCQNFGAACDESDIRQSNGEDCADGTFDGD